jgi:hypothetical protein
MRGPYFDHILTSMTLGLMLAAPLGAFAQDSNEPAATFNERFPADQTSTRPPLETSDAKKEQNARVRKFLDAVTSDVKKEQNVTTTTRIVSAKRARSRVVVRARSFLDAGTEVLPGERKFLDYAFPPTHVALAVVTNTGGRVGWHNSPLPGPLFPW